MSTERQILKPMTVAAMMIELESLVQSRPEILQWPVHLLDMDDGNHGDEPWHCLLTHIELDCFAENQGMVLSLLAEHESR